jgi:hypothetical protein
MPMGITNAVATFQRAMDHMLEEFLTKFLAVFVDDNLIHSVGIPEHFVYVSKVVNKMAKNNYKLNQIILFEHRNQ